MYFTVPGANLKLFGEGFVAGETRIKLVGCHGKALLPDTPNAPYTFVVDPASGGVGFKCGQLHLSGESGVLPW